MFARRRSSNWILVGIALIAVAAGCNGCPPNNSSQAPAAPDTITITVKLIGTEYKPSLLTRNPKRKPPSWIRWFNDTNTELRFSFKNNKNPFNHSEIAEIVVPPHAHTGWFMLSDGQDGNGHKDYEYQGTPKLSGPPGDPMVGADD